MPWHRLRQLYTFHKQMCSTMAKVKSEYNQQCYRYFLPIQTRVNDNDHYGHVNNSIYHFCVDTVVNNYLIWYCGLDTSTTAHRKIGYMVDTQCTYRKPMQYPQVLLGGLCVTKIGKSSVFYQVAFFEPKLDYMTLLKSEDQEDPHLKLGLGSQGLRVDDQNKETFHDIEKYYHTEASVVGKSVHVFVDNQNHRPVETLEENMLTGLQKVHVPKEVPIVSNL